MRGIEAHSLRPEAIQKLKGELEEDYKKVAKASGASQLSAFSRPRAISSSNGTGSASGWTNWAMRRNIWRQEPPAAAIRLISKGLVT